MGAARAPWVARQEGDARRRPRDPRSGRDRRNDLRSAGRAVGWSRRMVFLDEPTAALGVRQTRHVLDLIGRLRAQGIAIVLITHNMEQVLEVCDRVVVLRLGRKVADRPIAGLTGPMVVGYITGAERAEA